MKSISLSPRRAAVPLALALAAAGCVDRGDPRPPEAARCTLPFDPRRPAPPDLGAFTVQLGGAPRGDGLFIPWRDGERVPLLRGVQGGLMVDVRFAVAPVPPRPGDRCAAFRLDLYADGRGADLAAPPGAGPLPIAYADGAFTLDERGTSAALLLQIDHLPPAPLTLRDVDLDLRATAATILGHGAAAVRITPFF